jgi:hypothetical protein
LSEHTTDKDAQQGVDNQFFHFKSVDTLKGGNFLKKLSLFGMTFWNRKIQVCLSVFEVVFSMKQQIYLFSMVEYFKKLWKNHQKPGKIQRKTVRDIWTNSTTYFLFPTDTLIMKPRQHSQVFGDISVGNKNSGVPSNVESNVKDLVTKMSEINTPRFVGFFHRLSITIDQSCTIKVQTHETLFFSRPCIFSINFITHIYETNFNARMGYPVINFYIVTQIMFNTIC